MSNNRYNVEDLKLAAIFSFDGVKCNDGKKFKIWTFKSYAIVFKNERGNYANCLDSDEIYNEMNNDVRSLRLYQEVVDVIGPCAMILKSNQKEVTSREILDKMDESDLYFRDIIKKNEKPYVKMLKK